MADLDDVLNAIAALIDTTVYPNGDTQPSAIVVNGQPVPTRIYPGWPTSTALDADLAAGKINISVFAPPGMERNTTRYPRDWEVTSQPAATITASIDTTGTIVTFGGTVATPQNVAIIADDVAVAYQAQANDSLAAIATALANLLVAQGIGAVASSNTVTVANATSLVARVGTIGTASMEVKRQERSFQITFWCPSPASRTAAAKLVDPALALPKFLTLADGSGARIIYQRTSIDDVPQKANCWRRDLFYSVEYPTNAVMSAAEAIVITTTMQGAAPPVTDFTASSPPPDIFNA